MFSTRGGHETAWLLPRLQGDAGNHLPSLSGVPALSVRPSAQVAAGAGDTFAAALG